MLTIASRFKDLKAIIAGECVFMWSDVKHRSENPITVVMDQIKALQGMVEGHCTSMQKLLQHQPSSYRYEVSILSATHPVYEPSLVRVADCGTAGTGRTH